MTLKNEVTYDFRRHVFPDDELSYLFDEWVDYYRLKYAICMAIQPKRILEIGVRYGYSAITFLEACPQASYVGIDNDSNTHGGVVGALAWAEAITESYQAEFILTDSQKLQRFPGGHYDLIHVDGQQDGDGTFHDLELAVRQADYILVDGCFWSQQNMLASSYFMTKYQELIEFALIIPGYAGDLLIKIRPQRNNSEVTAAYDTRYYLGDCGGYDVFKRTHGEELDQRLAAVLSLVNPLRGEVVLDLGCGRGELAYHMARAGAEVTAVDYSETAVEIARQHYADKGAGLKLTYQQGDVCCLDTSSRYNKVVAADLVEHLDEAALDQMLAHAALVLDKPGWVVIHTAPNLLQYRYAYQKKRTLARRAGMWLPPSPRTYYEELMHINEQSPASLHRALRKHFKYVLTWVADLPDISTYLLKKPTRQEMKQAGSIFAVASHQPISYEKVIACTNQSALDRNGIKARLAADREEIEACPGQVVTIPIKVANQGHCRWLSQPPYPIHLSYHIGDRQGKTVIYDGLRTSLTAPLMPGQERILNIHIQVPHEVGDYAADITLVQEQCFWFEEVLPDLPARIKIKVR